MSFILSQTRFATFAAFYLIFSLNPGAQTSSSSTSTSTTPSMSSKSSVSERWSYQCKNKHCFISQVLISRNKEKAGIVGAINIAISSQKLPIVTLRFSNTAAKEYGLGIKIDESKPIRVSIQQCDTKVCETNMVADDTMLAELKNGKRFMVAFMNTEKEQTTLPFSLSGFTQAYEKLLTHSN
ncbi:invasion associated locus B family protein [Alteromonas naphthalenivorans]|uniref:Invasion associated locus B n=1 Tax=Alteromonas naphthalenivorans TaxID=715451 RepID=F5Z9S5_ALTNA|nr:invasion associated locus B family protein [Alteromonas naphthalenivorans]AEF02080.1 invasion associated locus B [Alteromonas naphthalenivorans]